MRDGHVTLQIVYMLLREYIDYLPHTGVPVDVVTIGRGDAGGLLSTMLERIQTQVGEIGRLRVAVDPDYSALILWLIIIYLGWGE